MMMAAAEESHLELMFVVIGSCNLLMMLQS